MNLKLSYVDAVDINLARHRFQDSEQRNLKELEELKGVETKYQL